MATTEKGIPKDIQIIRGLPVPNLPIFTKEKVEDAMNYAPRDDDVIIASYPKTGTTWMQYIVMQIVSKATIFSNFADVTFKLNPYIEMVGAAAIDALPKPRRYKHHLPYDMVQKNVNSKCIYTYRHPEDTIVSFYHFRQSAHPDISLEVDEFFDNCLSGYSAYGNYFKHVLSFYEHRDDSNLLMVSYEKLHANRRDEILRIAKFLGEEYHACLVEQDDILDKVMEHTSFDYMKKNLFFAAPGEKKEREGKTKVNFFRKGIVGDGKNVLTEDQQQRLKESAKTILKGTDILKEWYPDLI